MRKRVSSFSTSKVQLYDGSSQRFVKYDILVSILWPWLLCFPSWQIRCSLQPPMQALLLLLLPILQSNICSWPWVFQKWVYTPPGTLIPFQQQCWKTASVEHPKVWDFKHWNSHVRKSKTNTTWLFHGNFWRSILWLGSYIERQETIAQNEHNMYLLRPTLSEAFFSIRIHH